MTQAKHHCEALLLCYKTCKSNRGAASQAAAPRLVPALLRRTRKSVVPISRDVALLVISTLLLCGSMFAQSSLNGSITDSSGAAVPRASVKIVNSETGESYQVASNDSGNYDFPLVKPGRYSLTAELAGFKTSQEKDIVLETGVPTRVDMKLEVGAITEKITVESTAPLVQADTAAVGTVVEGQTIEDMPLIDRRAAQLAKLNGFTVQNTTGSSPQFSMAGGRGNNANWRLDGGNNNNILLGTSGVGFDPPIDSLQEFNVSISDYAAELGRTAGGVINMTTKSGTNEFHGTAYEFFRNTDLNTRSFFAAKVPILHYNLFGASIGGPIRKNKTFFFFNYEGQRQSSQISEILNVPTPAEVQGNFSADSYVVRDPTTSARTPYPGNIIPLSAQDPVGAKVAAFYPAPNVSGRPSGNSNFNGTTTDSVTGNNYVARVDHTIRDNDRVFSRFVRSGGPTNDSPAYTVAGVDSFQRYQLNGFLNASGTWVHNVTSSALNEMRFTYDRRKYIDQTGGTGTGLNGKLGIPGVDPTFFAQFTIQGLQGFGGTTEEQRLQTPIVGQNFADNFTLVKRNHQVKFGVEWRASQNQDFDRPAGGGTFNFNNVATGSSLAALLLGWVNSATVGESEAINSRMSSWGFFVQDDWKVNQKLTINVGLRWDLDVPRWEADNKQNSFSPTQLNPVCNCPGAVLFAGQNGVSKYVNNFDYKAIGPRLGLAYRISDKWVVRGGFGIVYIGEYDSATPTVAQVGFTTNGSFVSPDNGLTPATRLKNGVAAITFPTQAQLNSSFGAVALGASPTTAIDFFQPTGRREGYMEQYNLNVQRAIGKNLVVELGYLGNEGHHLASSAPITLDQVAPSLMGPGNAQIRRPFPQFSNVTIDAPDVGNSNYNAMNLRVQKRYSQGLQFQANYTFSRFINDIASRNEPGGVSNDFQNAYQRRGDRGLSGFDVKNRLVLSAVWEVPVGKGRLLDVRNRLLNTAVGGWSVGYIAVVQSGQPYGVVELTNTTNSFSPSLRPNVVGNPVISGSRSKAAQLGEWFNTAAFAAPALYTFGNAGRTDGYGPGLVNMDMSILKEFSIRERHKLEFRAEMLNFLNHANFANPVVSQGNAAFGQIIALYAGNQSRIVQFGLHYGF
jgi:hypothetical protein